MTDPLDLLTDLLHPPPPTSRSQADRQHISDWPAASDRPDRPSASISNAFQPTRKISSSESDSDSVVSDRPPVDIFVEEGELSDELDATVTDPDQSPSEEQSYRETMRGIRSFMGWTHIPDMDTTTGSSEDNPFAGPKLQTPGRISVQLPTDEWLCRKLSKLNLTLTDGYPSRSAEAGGLQRDQFLKPPRSQAKWYGCHPQQKSDTTETLTSWSTDSSKLNSGYLRIARQAGIATSPPQSRPISQDTLRKWEKSARESSVICNQAAGFNRCLMKVQQDMQSQLKVIRLEHKGKSSSKLATATEELQFLMDFNSSICQAMAKSMEHLTDSVFVNMANVTLLRRDSYLAYLKAGIKADTLAALRTAPLHISTLFPDTVLKQAEEDISNPDKGRSGSIYKKNRYHPYERQDKSRIIEGRTGRLGKIYPGVTTRGIKASTSSPRDLPRVNSLINDNQCITLLQERLLTGSIAVPKTINTLNVNCHVANLVHTAPGHSQRKELSPGSAGCHVFQEKVKSVKGASCVTQLSCATPVTNVPIVVTNLPVGARLQHFWETWLDLGAGPKVVQILREGYTLPFRIRPKLTRSPTVISCYVNPHRNSYLLEALHQLIDKNAVELVRNKTSLSFFNRLFLVPKPNKKWKPILDLSNLNFFLKAEKFKMETPETIRTSLQQGEWVTSIDFRDAYFHIPIRKQSRKYLRFHVQGQTYQFKSRLCPLVCPQHPWSSL